MIKKIIIFLLFALTCITCTSHNSTIFLNNDYTGGDLRIFCGEEVVIKNNIGVLVTFPSWYFHQADEVLSGERKVLVSFLKGERFEFFE